MSTPLDLIKKIVDDPRKLRHIDNDTFQDLAKAVLSGQQEDRKLQQIKYYKTVSERSRKIHLTDAHVVGVGGGNGSSKTETCLVEMIALATGVFPEGDRKLTAAFRKKFRGPIMCRVVLESLTTTLHPIILPKLKWWVWTGVGQQGGDKGHWGWVPKACLSNGSWDRSWSEKLRILTVKCFDPDTGEYLGDSSIQFMSHDQDPSDFASGDFHFILHDEPPREAIWVENEARTMRVNGRMFLAMTWPDDPAIPVDWIFDRIHDKATGKKGCDIVWFELHTTDNKNLNQQAIAAQMEKWSATIRQVRIFGKPIRFSNLIHPDFTDRDASWWCFACGEMTMAEPGKYHHECMTCGSVNVIQYCHVRDFEIQDGWPVIFALDPHPRKPHMFLWVAVDPHDDLWVMDDGECDGDPLEVRQQAWLQERELGMNVAQRLIDPNMGRSAPGVRREVTWQDEFRENGLCCDLADDSGVGRKRVNTYLKPDPHLQQPRLHIHPRCESTIFQLKRYTWADYKRAIADDKDIKQVPRDKYDDYPTLLKYVLNSEPSFRQLKYGAPVLGARPAYQNYQAPSPAPLKGEVKMKALICDGCGEPQARHADWATVGVIEQRDYCPRCAEVAKEYLTRRDELHNKVALLWKDWLDELDDEFQGWINDLPL